MSFALFQPAFDAGDAQFQPAWSAAARLYWAVYDSADPTPTAEQLLLGYAGTAVQAGSEVARADPDDHEIAPITGLADGTYKAAVVWFDGETFSSVTETAEFTVPSALSGADTDHAAESGVGGISQTHGLSGSGASGGADSGTGGTTQAHTLGGDAGTQDASGGTGSVSTDGSLSGENSDQGTSSGTGGVSQTHSLTGAGTSHDAGSASGAAGQTHTLGGEGASQSVAGGDGDIIIPVPGACPSAAEIAAAVWAHPSATLLLGRMADAWGRLGLDISRPVIQDQTEISFGEIVLALTESGGQVTVARQ